MFKSLVSYPGATCQNNRPATKAQTVRSIQNRNGQEFEYVACKTNDILTLFCLMVRIRENFVLLILAVITEAITAT